MKFPMGVRDDWRKGLYHQLAWAANQLNLGFYMWRVNGASTWLLGDGSVVPVASTINAGTAGVQQLFSSLYNREGWEQAVSPEGLFAVYNSLFGYPFDYAIEPSPPTGMRQPALLLPFEAGKAWAFTGGPHGGWDSGSAWAALDFAPSTDALGCIPSDEWVTASADGQILRADHGAVIQDLDNDGLEQTGWVLLYMHIETSRIASSQELTCAPATISVTHPAREVRQLAHMSTSLASIMASGSPPTNSCPSCWMVGCHAAPAISMMATWSGRVRLWRLTQADQRIISSSTDSSGAHL